MKSKSMYVIFSLLTLCSFACGGSNSDPVNDNVSSSSSADTSQDESNIIIETDDLYIVELLTDEVSSNRPEVQLESSSTAVIYCDNNSTSDSAFTAVYCFVEEAKIDDGVGFLCDSGVLVDHNSYSYYNDSSCLYVHCNDGEFSYSQCINNE